MNKKITFKVLILTIFSLIAFAGNSIICKYALGNNMIDASSFSSIRLLSGVIILFVLMKLKYKKARVDLKVSWVSSVMLFVYVTTFSFSYISLDTGVGALILFTSVQITMITFSILSGIKLSFLEWIGILITFIGFLILIIPGVSSPPLIGFLLMTSSGIAWGIYTLRGGKAEDSLIETANNFFKTVPFVLLLIILSFGSINFSSNGAFLAIISGAITSAIGYTIWYYVLGYISKIQASVLQLLIPIIASFGGVIFVSENLTIRLVTSTIIVILGILLIIFSKGVSKKI